MAGLLCQPAFGQDPDELKKEIEALKKGQQAIQKDLADIKRLLQSRGSGRQAPPGEAILNLKGQPYMGMLGAPVVLVEFSDYQ